MRYGERTIPKGVNWGCMTLHPNESNDWHAD